MPLLKQNGGCHGHFIYRCHCCSKMGDTMGILHTNKSRNNGGDSDFARKCRSNYLLDITPICYTVLTITSRVRTVYNHPGSGAIVLRSLPPLLQERYSVRLMSSTMTCGATGSGKCLYVATTGSGMLAVTSRVLLVILSTM